MVPRTSKLRNSGHQRQLAIETWNMFCELTCSSNFDLKASDGVFSAWNAREKETVFMKSKQSSRNQMSYWQLIFSKSKVNGAPYCDDELPVCNWSWPTGTYLQRRRSDNESLTAFGPTASQLSERDGIAFS
jgi:hypothetical protein